MGKIELKYDTKKVLKSIKDNGFNLIDGEKADTYDEVMKIMLRLLQGMGFVNIEQKYLDKLWKEREDWEFKNLVQEEEE